MNKLQSLLAGFAAAVGAGGIAAYNGAFSPDTPPAQIASQPAPAAGGAATTNAEPAKPAETASAQTASPPAAEQPAAPQPTPEPAGPIAPVFDVLRVEPNGSVLVAGKADPEANVEILNGSEIIGKAKAEMNGDFAIVIEKPLKPGDYQLVLRATRPDGQAANSIETATVSVPDEANGQVLALVEKPGEASRIITAPQGTEAKVPMDAEVPAAADATAPAEPATPAAETAQAPAQSAAPAEAPTAAPAATVGLEAVEVEGNKIFVAGKAGGAANVRIYANDELLGDATPGEGDRFLLDVQKDLAPGDYIIRAEGLAADGVTMLSRSSVPFQKVAPDAAQPETQAAANTAAPAAETQPSGTAQATSEPQKKNVIIRRGDTLWQISRRIYGRGVRYSTIYLANEGVTQNPDRIFPGQVFTIPEKTPEGEAANVDEIKKREELAN